MRSCLFALVVVATLAVPLSARGDDSVSAIDELKIGYGLKQAGHCAEAISHFVASFRADPKPKAALNLADCEQQSGDLLAAYSHATQGRDLASQQKDSELVDVAGQQLASIEKRLPRLTLRLSPNAPAGVTVTRDGAAVTASSLGVAVGVNPGLHHITATAPGYAARTFDVTLAERDRQDVEVQVGAPTSEAHPSPAAAVMPVATGPDEASGAASISTRQVLTYGALGLGGVGIAVGIVAGIEATSKHTALEGECPGSNCTQSEIDSFHSLRTWSTVGYAVGIAGLVGGTVLWLTAPKPAPGNSTAANSATRVWIGPASAGVAGAF